MYYNGEGVAQDYGMAFNWFYKAAFKNNNTEAYYYLGEMCMTGNGVKEKDDKVGFQWFKAAADLGHIGAMKKLSELYKLGVGVRANESMSKKWAAKAKAAETEKKKN